MCVRFTLVCLLFVSSVAWPQETTVAARAQPPADIRALMLEVERNAKASEAAQRDYTYRVHVENTELKSDGSVKKTTSTDSDSFTIDGVRVNKITARDGKPLDDNEAKKEDERVDKEVAKAKDERAKREAKGQNTDARGDEVLSVSRILELGSFSNLRAGELNGRPMWVIDYAGDPNAKTHSEFEKVVRNLVGTVWIDQADHVLAASKGHFVNDFKIGGGLLLNVHKGLSFEFSAVKVDGAVWLPSSIDARGSMRYLLFGGVNGRLHLVCSNYRKFRTSSTIIPSNRLIGPDGNPLPQQPETPQTETPKP